MQQHITILQARSKAFQMAYGRRHKSYCRRSQRFNKNVSCPKKFRQSPPSKGEMKMRENIPPSEGGESAVTGETRIQDALDAVTSPRTFQRWDENTGILHTFRRWDGETGKVCNDGRNLMCDAVYEGCCERDGWYTILQWDRIAGSAVAVKDKRKGSRKERKEDGKRLYGAC